MEAIEIITASMTRWNHISCGVCMMIYLRSINFPGFDFLLAVNEAINSAALVSNMTDQFILSSGRLFDAFLYMEIIDGECVF